MIDSVDHRRFHSESSTYTFFDGFTSATMPMKIAYVLSFPLIPALMEAYRWNKAEHEARDAEARETSRPHRGSIAAEPTRALVANEDNAQLNLSEQVGEATRFQESVLTRRQTAPGKGAGSDGLF
jgi:hypothetical protein